MSSTYIIGRHQVIEALENDQKIDKVLMSRGVRGEVIDTIRQLCHERQIAVQYVPEIKLDKEVRGSHQGVAALLSAIEYYELQDVVNAAMDSGEQPLVVVLDEITDVRNIGAIARTALGMGVHGLVIPQKGGAQIQADAIKTSAGALLRLPVCRVGSLVAALRDLKLNGFHIAGIHAHTSTYISSIHARQPLALVLGAEDTGISPQVQKEVDAFYKIPMEKIESFNVSVSAAICLYQIAQNRS